MRSMDGMSHLSFVDVFLTFEDSIISMSAECMLVQLFFSGETFGATLALKMSKGWNVVSVVLQMCFCKGTTVSDRPVQDTFKKYQDTDIFKILSETKYLDTYTCKIPSEKIPRCRYFLRKKYLDTDTFKILSEKSI